MKINQISRRIKRGFTLIELTVVILTTSILLVGFTAFTLFFTNQYSYEMEINDTENSAITLKYAIGNNIDKFNYTYETSEDFIVEESSKNGVYIDESLKLFSTITPIEGESLIEDTSIYTGAIIRHYKFVLADETHKPYFGYKEEVYNFEDDIELKNNIREKEIRQYCVGNPESEEEFIVYEARSKMRVDYKLIDVVNNPSTGNICKKFQFTINYDFAAEGVTEGTRKIVFSKYINFID